MLKKGLTGIILLIIPLCAAGCDQGQVDTLTYAVFPYLPDVEYYQEIIEDRGTLLLSFQDKSNVPLSSYAYEVPRIITAPIENSLSFIPH